MIDTYIYTYIHVPAHTQICMVYICVENMSHYIERYLYMCVCMCVCVWCLGYKACNPNSECVMKLQWVCKPQNYMQNLHLCGYQFFLDIMDQDSPWSYQVFKRCCGIPNPFSLALCICSLIFGSFWTESYESEQTIMLMLKWYNLTGPELLFTASITALRSELTTTPQLVILSHLAARIEWTALGTERQNTQAFALL